MSERKKRTRMKKAEVLKKPRLGIIPKKSKSSMSKWIPFMVLIVAYAVLFVFLKDKLLFTPDFDRTDSFHFNYSLKHHLSEALHHLTLPFWTEKLQGGFPLLAEGQSGALFLPNIFILGILPVKYGYNILLISSLFFITLGSWFLFMELGVSQILSLLLAFNFAFNGALSFRWVHLNLIQAFSFAPLLFFFILKLVKQPSKQLVFGSSFLISQIIFAGHFQTAFIVFFGLICWFIAWFFIYKNEISKKRVILYFLSILIFGVVWALPQILPTYQLFTLSGRRDLASYDYATSYPLTWGHLLSFIIPFPFGNPKLGSYPPFTSNWGIFWENTPYVGSILAFVFFLSTIWLLVKRKIQREAILYYLLFFIFVLFALGKDSPLYFIFDLFPFNLFRTPSKYLLIACLFLFMGMGVILKEITHKMVKGLIGILLCFNIISLLFVVFDYHLFVPQKQLLQSINLLPISSFRQGFYLSTGFSRGWNNLFLSKGWNSKKDVDSYLSLNGYVIPDSSLIHGLKSFELNTGGLRLRRSDYIDGLFHDGLVENNNKIYISTSSSLLASLVDLKTIISDKEIQSGMFQKKDTLNNVYVYQASQSASNNELYYVPRNVKKIVYLNEVSTLAAEGYLSRENALYEGNVVVPPNTEGKPQIKIQKNTETESILKTNFNKPLFLVLKKTWYPEWQLKVDGKNIDPIKTNIIHMGLVVPAGIHEIRLIFIPKTFIAGVIFVLLGIVVLLVVRFP